MKNIDLSKAILLIGMVTFNACNYSNSESLQPIPFIGCDDNSICKGILYDIEVSMHNMKVKNTNGLSAENEIVKYCLIVDSDCGVRMYFSLDKLYKHDSIKFSFLRDKYFIGDRDKFLEKITKETVEETVQNIITIKDDILISCECS